MSIQNTVQTLDQLSYTRRNGDNVEVKSVIRDDASDGSCNDETVVSIDTLIKRKAGNSESILTLYTSKPKGIINLEDMYRYTSERYELLTILSDLGDCESESKDNWLQSFIEKLGKMKLNKFKDIILDNFDDINTAEKLIDYDIISHYVLRRACSRLYESLKWFIKQEIKLFHIRWYFLNDSQRINFLERNNLTLNRVSPEERILLFDKFRDIRIINDLFKVNFYEASQLFKSRTVYMVKGWVYFKLPQAVYPISTLYYKYLNENLRFAKKKYDNFTFDSRYSYFFQRISNDIKESSFKFNNTEKSLVRITDLDGLSTSSFPLCMSILHYYLKKTCHLRNGGRFQYNLFLKGIGVTLFDSIKFWRGIFTKKMSLEQFTKDYLYGIRHGYGKIGKQADYPPLSCTRILESTPGPLDYHGCPYKNFESDMLTFHLKRNGLDDESIESVLDMVKKNLPQQACRVMFELKHNQKYDQAALHPNWYFYKSQKCRMLRLQNSKSTANNTCNNCSSDNNHCIVKKKKLDW